MPSAIRIDLHLGHFYELCGEGGFPAIEDVEARLDALATRLKRAVYDAVVEATGGGADGVPLVAYHVTRGLSAPLGESAARLEASRTISGEFDFS